MTTTDYQQWGPFVETLLLRSAPHLPKQEDILNGDPTACWRAILNSHIAPGQQGNADTFIRVQKASITGPEDNRIVKINAAVFELQPLPTNPITTYELEGTGLYVTASTARDIIKEHSLVADEQQLNKFFDRGQRSVTGRDGKKIHAADIIAAFGTMKAFLDAIRNLRTEIANNLSETTVTVNGAPLTIAQAIHIADNLWHPDPTAEDVARIMTEAGVDSDRTDRAVDDIPSFTTAIRQFRPYFEKCGTVIFSYQERAFYGDFLHIDPYISSNLLIPTICWKLFTWGAAHDTLRSWKGCTSFTEKNYGLALCGYDFDLDYYPSRRTITTETIASVAQTATNDHERRLATELLHRAENEPETSDDYPVLADVMSLGMQEARIAGSSDWIGRRGLASINHGFHLKFMYQPNRSWHLAYDPGGTVRVAAEKLGNL